MFNPLHTGFLFICFKEIRVCEQHYGYTDERIFMIFLGKVGHETKITLEHFQDIDVSPLNLGSILLFSWSVFVYNIMEKRVNGFSWNFHDMSGTIQGVIIWTISRMTRLFHGLTSRRGGVSVSNITVKWIKRFSWNFQDSTVVTRETIWNSLGMMHLTTWMQGPFFYFPGLCLLLTLCNNRIWT